MSCFSGPRLREVRTAAGKRREFLAAAAGVSASAITRYELGTITPSVNTAVKMAEALNCQVTDLFDGTAADTHDISLLPPWAQRLIADLRAGVPGSREAARAVSAA